MEESMRSLIQVQECDNRIRQIENKKKEGPERITALQENLKAAEAEFQLDNSRLEEMKRDRRKAEQEAQDLESKIGKSAVKLSHIKSNKEYQAALKEIDDLKNLKFATEDKVLQIMESIEDLETRCRANRKKQDELKQRFELEKKEIQAEIQALDRELEEVKKTRATFCSVVDRELLERYNFLKERKGGQAVSAVVKGICQTCNMVLPPQKFNELLRGGAVMSCPFCQRIIYCRNEEKDPGVKGVLEQA